MGSKMKISEDKGGDFYNHSYRDLYDFASRIKENFSDFDVVQSAQYVMSAINNAMLIEKHRDGDYHGISIFLPDDQSYYSGSDRNTYKNLDFSSATYWDEFLDVLYGG